MDSGEVRIEWGQWVYRFAIRWYRGRSGARGVTSAVAFSSQDWKA